jgi:hypothetical protein
LYTLARGSKYEALVIVERQMALPEDPLSRTPTLGMLIALVESLREGVVSPAQADTIRTLRAGLLALQEEKVL